MREAMEFAGIMLASLYAGALMGLVVIWLAF